jgi:hypothetical protein
MILWHRLDSKSIERAVQMLLRRLHPDCLSIDGAGGDGGRDVRYDSSDGLIIFEVKSFTDRLSRKQERQIEKSLKKASSHDPISWILIIPLNPSPAEETWFDGLKEKYPKIKLQWRGQDWLDGQFAQHEDLKRAVEGDESDVTRRLQELNLEQAAMTKGMSDIQERIDNVMKRTEELSLYWQFGVSAGPEGMTLSLFEKFPGAAQEDPIEFRSLFSFSNNDPDASEAERQLREALDYGTEVTVDGRFINSFEVVASDATKTLFGEAFSGDLSEIEIKPIEDNSGLPLDLTICSVDSSGVEQGSLMVRLGQRSGGQKGVRLHGTDSSGVIAIDLKMDHPSGGIVKSEFTITVHSVHNQLPRTVRPAVDLVRSLQPGSSLYLQYGYTRLAALEFEEAAFPELEFVIRLVRALDELQRHFQQSFPIQEEMSVQDILQLEAIVEMLKEGEAEWPYTGITTHIKKGKIAQFMRKIDETPGSGEGGAIFIRFDGWKYQISGKEFDLGIVSMYSPHMILTNRDELESAIPLGVTPDAHWKCAVNFCLTIRRHDVKP